MTNNKKILVVEDESIVALHLADSLKKLGYTVSAIVDTGEKAVNKAAEVQPDLILMDIVLKGGMDGVAAAGLIRGKLGIPVIYLTAYGDENTLQRAKITEPLGYILKPFNERELRAAIEMAFYRHEMETKLRKMERWLSTTLKSIGDGVITTNRELNVTFMNKIAEELTGWEQEDALGKKLTEIFNIKGEDVKSVEEVLADKVLKEGIVINLMEDHILIAKNNMEIPVSDSAAPIREEKDSIPGMVLVFRDITERKKLEETIRFQAYHDFLTTLPNRALFVDHLSLKLADARRSKKKLAVMFLDVDNFKKINDTFGHMAGDKLLKELAERVKTCIRGSDTVARIGGDEFSILLSDISHEVDAAVSAGKILAVFDTPSLIDGYEMNVSASIGISIYPDDGCCIDDLMKNADIAMYQAKEEGRNNYQFYDPATNTRTLERIMLENSLRQAIDHGELVLHYQPQADAAMKTITGAEALVRWQHPELGLLEPARFLPLAEEIGFIKLIDSWALRTACAQNMKWRQSGLPPVNIAVNLSAQQFQLPDLSEKVKKILNETGFDPQHLSLEITEGVVMKDVDLTIPNTTRLINMGISFSIDDFGTGYSSFSRLKKVHLNKLKIDKTFIQDITVDSGSRSIINAIIAMARSLNLRVIAEGVEHTEQIEYLRSIGCDEIQGYLFSKPLPADEFEALLIKQQVVA